jgi:hypothetical protein
MGCGEGLTEFEVWLRNKRTGETQIAVVGATTVAGVKRKVKKDFPDYEYLGCRG